MDREKKVLCVGLCCLDLVMVCQSFPEEDSDQRCVGHAWQRGGNASNSSTVIAEYGIPCEMMGSMGTDIAGQFLAKDFESRNISIEHCRFYEEFPNPISTIWINDLNGSRTIVHSNKNMPEVQFEDFKTLDLRNYSWIHFEIRPSYEGIQSMIRRVREFNASGVDDGDRIRISIEIEKPRVALRELLPLGDFVFVSKDFAKACGCSDMASAVESLSRELRPSGALICAWGEKGASAKTTQGPLHVCGAFAPERVVDTLGAGDTFVGATIVALIRGKSLNDAIRSGCRIAGTKCGMHGTRGLADLCPDL